MHSFQPIFLKQFDLKLLHLQNQYGSDNFSIGLYLVDQIRWAFHPFPKCAKSFCINITVLSMQTVSMIQTSLMLHIIAVVWKQLAAAGFYVWVRFSPAKSTVLEEVHFFSEALPKMHHRQMLAQLLNIVVEDTRNSDEILKCLKLSPFFISRFNKIWTWQTSETTHLENKCEHSLHKLLMAAFVLWTPIIL